MIRLENTLRAWGTSAFGEVFKQEAAQLGADQLPLQQGLSSSSSVTDDPVTVVILNIAGMEHVIRVKAGIFYQGMISGCSCSDDPTPDNTINEYCEMLFDIDKSSAATTVTLVAEED